MPRKRILWGIIGCGEVTERKSGPAFDEVEGSHVVAVMSRNEHNARSYAERNHIAKWYTDAQELIDDPDINAVYVASPIHTRHLCHYGHEGRQTGLCGKTACRLL